MVRKNRLLFLSLFSGAIAVSGCAASSAYYTVPSSTSALNTSGSTLATSSTGTTTTGTTSSTTTSTGTSSPYTFTVRAVGYTSTTVSVSANSVLQVEFAPGIQDTAVAGTGVYPEYSQLGVYIGVGSNTQPTQMLTNGYNGTTAETSSVIDFSSYIPSGSCAGQPSTCRTNVTITISKPNYDYWCLNTDQFCPWSWVYSTHPWNGTLTVATDDTIGI